MKQGNAGAEAMSGRSCKESSSYGLEPHRAEILATIISKARVVCSLPALEPDDLLAAVLAWEEILSDLHTDWLDCCYRRAMRSHKWRAPFGASEIYQAWEQVTDSAEYRQWRTERNRKISTSECPNRCQQGWIFVDETGGRGGVRPCPTHKPGWK